LIIFVENLEKMFTTGQWVFAALFFVAFVIAIYFAYAKDKALHEKFYKGSYKVLLGFLAFILILFLIKVTLKH
jgi:cytochrome bd-type quinol oxidase subunit 1